MLVRRDNHGSIIGWRKSQILKNEIVDVSVNGKIDAITTRDKDDRQGEVKILIRQTTPAGRIFWRQRVNSGSEKGIRLPIVKHFPRGIGRAHTGVTPS
jgi:hypothetical protein